MIFSVVHSKKWVFLRNNTLKKCGFKQLNQMSPKSKYLLLTNNKLVIVQEMIFLKDKIPKRF